MRGELAVCLRVVGIVLSVTGSPFLSLPLSLTVRMDSFNGSEAPMVHYQQDQVIVTEVEERERTAAELVELEK